VRCTSISRLGSLFTCLPFRTARRDSFAISLERPGLQSIKISERTMWHAARRTYSALFDVRAIVTRERRQLYPAMNHKSRTLSLSVMLAT
jgi:hypothetical protein